MVALRILVAFRDRDGIGRRAKLIARNVKSSLICRHLFDRPGTRAGAALHALTRRKS
jgi:hypothetical protein